MALLFRVCQVNDLHCETRESVCPTERTPERVYVGHIHSWPCSPKPHCQGSQVASTGMLSCRVSKHTCPTEHPAPGSRSGRARGRGDDGVLDDRTPDLHPDRPNRSRNSRDRFRRDSSHSGDERSQPTPDALYNGKEPRVSRVVAHLFTSLMD
jgi:hypothetical protein